MPSLISVLKESRGKTVLIGARSSFFFVGQAEEALEDIDILGRMVKICPYLAANKDISRFIDQRDEKICERRVVKTYCRNDRDTDTVIVVEGKELGAFWTREEYLEGRRALMNAISFR